MSSDFARYTANVNALRVLRSMQLQGRRIPTDLEVEALSKYVGWAAEDDAKKAFGSSWSRKHSDDLAEVAPVLGAAVLKQSLEAASYSPPEVAQEVAAAVWQAARQLVGPAKWQAGGLLALDLCAGAGAITEKFYDAEVLAAALGSDDKNTGATREHKIVGVAADPIARRILEVRVPGIATLQKVDGMVSAIIDSTYDLVVSAAPVGDWQSNDTMPNGRMAKIGKDAWLCERAVRALRPGGVAVLLFPQQMMAREDAFARAWIAERCELIGALAMPHGSVVSEFNPYYESRQPDWHLLCLRKRPERAKNADQLPWVTTPAPSLVAVASVLDLAAAIADNLPNSILRVDTQKRERVKPPKHAGRTMEENAAVACYRDLRRAFDAQARGEDCDALLATAAKKFNALVAKFGGIQSAEDQPKHPLRGMIGTREYRLMVSVESYPSTIAGRSMRTMPPRRHFNSARDAALMSIDAVGYVSAEWIGKHFDLQPIDVESLLSDDSRATFRVGDNWLLDQDYLCGDLRGKIRAAEAAALIDPKLQRNVDALHAVLPPELARGEFKAPLGAPWIDPEIIREFGAYLCGSSYTRGVQVRKIPCGGGWYIEATGSREANGIENQRTWGVEGMTGIELLGHALNLRSPIVKKDSDEPDPETGKFKKVIDQDATARAQAKVEEIREEWHKWVASDESRMDKLCDEYSRRFSGFRRRKYDGKHLSFPYLSLYGADRKPFEPRMHQREAIDRIASTCTPDDSALVVHTVGYGKTFSMLSAAVRRWHTNKTHRCFIVVPKNVLRQWRGMAAAHFPTLADEFLIAPEELNTTSIMAAAQIGNGEVLFAATEAQQTNRMNFFSRVAAGDAAIVVLTYEQFASLPPTQQLLMAHQDRELQPLDDIIASMGDSWVEKDEKKALVKLQASRRKSAEKHYESNESRWAKLRTRAEKKKERMFSWEDVCGDPANVALFFDEWQYLKKVPIHTKMSRVAGLPKDDSLRALDAIVKVHHVLMAGGKAGGLTGTPITNSLAEAFVAMRFFQPNRLRISDIEYFDEWAATFTEPVIGVEMDAVGEFRPVTRLKFVNLPELVEILGETWAFSSISLEVDRPSLVSGQSIIIEVEGSPELKQYVEELAKRADDVKARAVTPDVDNMLKITSDGRRASMWNGPPMAVFPLAPPRNRTPISTDNTGMTATSGMTVTLLGAVDVNGTIIADVPDALLTRIVTDGSIFGDEDGDEGENARPVRRTKVDACADKIWELYVEHHDDRGVQLVFCDLATPKGEADATDTDAEQFAARGIYGELKNRLVDRGMLADHVAFIHDYKTEDSRVELFRQVNDGEIRVLIGSTDKLGVGTNPQRRVVAMHHLDCPWRPDQLIQRSGRGRRDGNVWDSIYEFIYVTSRSYDVCLWQLIQIKAEFISRLQEGDASRRSIEDVGDLVLTSAMAKALALGDPRVVDKIRLETTLAHLERQRASWLASLDSMKREVKELPAKIDGLRTNLEIMRAASDLKIHSQFTVSLMQQTMDGRRQITFDDAAKADSALYVLGNQSLRKMLQLRGIEGVQVGTYRGRPLILAMLYGAPAAVLEIGGGVKLEVLNIRAAGTFADLDRQIGMLDVRAATVQKTIEQESRRLAGLLAELNAPWSGAEKAKTLLAEYEEICAALAKGGLVDRRNFKL